MKIIKYAIVPVSLFLSGCAAGTASIQDLQPAEQNTLAMPLTAPYKDGFFYVSDDMNKLIYAENNNNCVYISDLSFNDDYPAGEKEYFEKYHDSILMSSIYVNNSRIYYTSLYESTDGRSSFRLYSLSPDGGKRKEIMEFPYQPVQFILHRKSIICVEYDENNNSSIHVYDNSGKELTSFTENGPVYGLFADGNAIYYQMQDISTLQYRIRKYDMEERNAVTVSESESIAMDYESGGKLAYHELSQLFLKDTDPRDITVTSAVVQLDNMDNLFTVTDEIIAYFDEESIYTSSLKEEKTVYRIYSWDGSLKKEIVPSDSISGNYTCASGWAEQDFSGIVHVLNGNVIAYAQEPYSFISCNTDSGMCKVIHE